MDVHVNNSTEFNFTYFSTIAPPPDFIEIALFSILIAWTLVGNVLVIAVVFCNQNLRTNINYLIVNMAVSDLLIPLISVPLWLLWFYMEDKWLVADDPLSNALCKLASFLAEMSPFVSSVSLVIIAIQRFVVVAYPVTRRRILNRKTRWVLIVFPWIAAMALCSPHLYTSQVVTDEVWGNSCVSSSWSANAIFFAVALTIGFVIPLIIIITLYAIMLYNLRKSLNSVMGLIEKETIRSRQRRNRQIFSMLITIIVVFTVCWCPFSVVTLSLYTKLSSLWSLDMETISKLNFAATYMWYSLAAINPCIYFLFLKDFRRGLCCCRNSAVVAPANELQITRRPRELADGDR